MKQDYFDRVYEKTYRPLLRYAIVHLSDPFDAEDALQNVYVEFYRRIESRGHADVFAPQAYLMRMLKHEIVKRYAERTRRSAYETESYEESDAVDPVSVEELAMDRAMAEQVLKAAKSLSPDSYRVFVLYYGFGMTVAEIAKETMLGTEAVKSRLHRARAAVRKRLAVGQNQIRNE